MALKVKISQILCICFILFLTNSMAADDTDLDYFGRHLFSELAKNNLQKNIVISPLSIQTCIAMARIGATGNTAIEIDKGFGISSGRLYDLQNYYLNLFEQIEKYQNSSILKIANKVYIKKGYEVHEYFNKLLTKYFFSTVDALNFTNSNAAAQTINNWVENKTDHMIKNLIQPQSLNADTSLVLVNAIHFKGEWERPFLLKHKVNFYLDATKTVKVPMMITTGRFHYGHLPSLDAIALEMPYKNSDLSMLIILPKLITGLSNLEKKLKNIPLTELKKNMRLYNTIVVIPRFKAEFEVELSDPLKNLGMRRMFSGDAEFYGILKPSEFLKVSKVVHKTFIEVNEAGTTAAASTGAEISSRSGETKLFRADKPFFYFIENEKNVTIFSGHVKQF